MDRGVSSVYSGSANNDGTINMLNPQVSAAESTASNGYPDPKTGVLAAQSVLPTQMKTEIQNQLRGQTPAEYTASTGSGLVEAAQAVQNPTAISTPIPIPATPKSQGQMVFPATYSGKSGVQAVSPVDYHKNGSSALPSAFYGGGSNANSSAVAAATAVAPCFGPGAEPYANQLLPFINNEYIDCIYYGILARRAPTSGSCLILRKIAKDERAHCRKFAAAYFLITGNRFLPSPALADSVAVPRSFIQALRNRYQAEFADAAAYREFARQTQDACLKDLAERTAEDELQHAAMLLDMIQNMPY